MPSTRMPSPSKSKTPRPARAAPADNIVHKVQRLFAKPASKPAGGAVNHANNSGGGVHDP